MRGKVPTFLYASNDEFFRIEEELYNQIRLGSVGTTESKWIRKDGTLRDMQVSGALIAPQDVSAGIVFTVIDITARKRAEERTRHLASFPQMNPNPVIEADASGEITFFNPAAQEVLANFGLDNEGPRAFLPGDMRLLLEEWDRKNQSIVYREVTVKDAVFRETVHFIPHFNVVRIYADDVTDRRRAEKALRESEERYRIAIENSNDGIVLARKDRLIFANRRFLEISGYDSEEEVLNIDSSELVHPADRERVSVLAEMRMRGEAVPARYEFRGIKKDGTEREMEASVASLFYRGERVSLVHFRDITERKRAEASLRESENKFRDLVEKAIIGVYLVQDGLFKYVNSRFAEIHGYDVDELIDRKGPQETIVPEDLPEVSARTGQRRPTDVLPGFLTVQNKDKTRRDKNRRSLRQPDHL